MDPSDMDLDFFEDIIPLQRLPPHRWSQARHLNHDGYGANPQELVQFAHPATTVSVPGNQASFMQQSSQNCFSPQHLHYPMQEAPLGSTYQAPSGDRRRSFNTDQVSSNQQYSLTSSWGSIFDYDASGPSHSAAQNRGMNHTNQNENDDSVSLISCTSACRVSCPSQCGETSQGMYCNDDACTDQGFCLDESCEDAGQLCTNENCTTVDAPDSSLSRLVISDGDKQAAAALASFGDMQLEPDHFPQLSQNLNFTSLSAASFGYQTGESPYVGFARTPSSSVSLHVNSSNANLQDLTNPGNFFASHILEYHNPMRNEAITHPCPVDHGMFQLSRCTLPKTQESASLNDDAFAQHLNDDHPCGYEVDNLAQFAHHLFADHNVLQVFDNEANNLIDSASLLPSDLSALPGQLGSISAAGVQQLSLPTSPVPNLSADSSVSCSSTIISTPSSSSDKWHTELVPNETIDQLPSSQVSPQPELATGREHICRWKTGPEGLMCGLRFSNANELHEHGKRTHTGTQIKDQDGFRCLWSGCSRSDAFNQRSKLDRHLQTHTGFKPVHCSICGEQLSAKQALVQHMRTHTGEEPWKCSHKGCSRTFKQQSALTMHERTHTGVRPLKCRICGKTFAESSNLAKHRRTHDKEGGFLCPVCGRVCNRVDQVRRHVISQHKATHPELADMARGKTIMIERRRP